MALGISLLGLQRQVAAAAAASRRRGPRSWRNCRSHGADRWGRLRLAPDWLAGIGQWRRRITKAIRSLGYRAVPFDKCMSGLGWAVDGNLGALRDTQSYTRRFGRVVASIYDQGRVVPPPPAAGVGSDDDMSLLEMLSSDDSWQDAELDSVFAFLRGSAAP